MHTISLSRLGVKSAILTKVGSDAYGNMICDELAKDGVDINTVVRKQGITSPFTYVIVDMEGQTRTCIHTPSEGKLVKAAEGYLAGSRQGSDDVMKGSIHSFIHSFTPCCATINTQM